MLCKFSVDDPSVIAEWRQQRKSGSSHGSLLVVEGVGQVQAQVNLPLAQLLSRSLVALWLYSSTEQCRWHDATATQACASLAKTCTPEQCL